MISRARLAALIIALTLVGCHARAEPAESGYSAAGLYNLANSYARAGKPGLAVLNYERASLLAPDDSDVDANLRYVRDSLGLASEPPNWFDRAARVASPMVLSWMGVVGLSLLGMGLLAGRIVSRHRLLRLAAAAVGMALVGVTVANGVALWPKLHEGVVITGATPVRAAPVPMGDALFVLPEAETVSMVAEHESFLLVRTRTGRMGWVSRANLAPVVASKADRASP
ncbi:MAG: hypothetical protein ACLPV8_09725 [Steroidobacteraceae bacterium]